ncbi:MAG: TSUP family transporter [Chitinivibrionales bacterium]|nr:TSUP family transporter [Chitinivibrionales bacterium]MBD3356573.1 TSUP family transporter [Chitinivibrionales bacterium]
MLLELFGLSLVDLILRLGIGTFVGFAIGMTGVGGGVLVMPALTVVLGIPASVAVGTASFYAFLTKAYAVGEHWRLKTINWHISMLFLIGAIPASIATSLLVLQLANQENAEAVAAFQNSLKGIISYVMVLAAVLLMVDLWRKSRSRGPGKRADGTSRAATLTMPKRVTGVFLGSIVGILLAATSVGGGVLVIPLLVLVFSLPASKTVGSSILIALVLTLVTSILYWGGGNLDYITGLCMWIGSLAGVFFGSRLAVKVPDKALQAIVIGIIWVATAGMFLGGGGH